MVSFLLLILFYFCFVKGVITNIMTSHGDLRVDRLLKSRGLGKPLFLIHSDWISMKTLSHNTLGQLPASQTLSPSHSVFTMAACQKDFRHLGPQDTVSLNFLIVWPWRDLCRHGNLRDQSQSSVEVGGLFSNMDSLSWAPPS